MSERIEIMDSMLLYDKMLKNTIDEINTLEGVEYASLVQSDVEKQISALLNQIYRDREVGNFRSGFRKCVCLNRLVERERGRIDAQ